MSYFSGLISDRYKLLFKQAIEEVIRGCEVPCKLVYSSAKLVECTSCPSSDLGINGPNPYLTGGLGSFTTNCSVCGGSGKIKQTASETINMPVIWEYKKYEYIADVAVPEGDAVTITKMDLVQDIKSCNYIILNTNLEPHSQHKMYLVGEPNPCGLGQDAFLISTWSKNKK